MRFTVPALILFCLSTNLFAKEPSELAGCLASISRGNESYCYRMQAMASRTKDCPNGDLDWCAEVKHRRALELEEKRIEVLARLKDIGAGTTSISSEITSANTIRNRNENTLNSHQRVGDNNG